MTNEETEPTAEDVFTLFYLKGKEAGKSDEQIQTEVEELMRRLRDASVPAAVQEILDHKAQIIADYEEYNLGFVSRLRGYWGEALDLMYLTIMRTTTLAAEFYDRCQTHDHLFAVLMDLLGRACRVAQEVHVLCEQGYPLGALARSRTLHEIGTIAAVLAKYDGEPGQEDLAERYQLHRGIENRRDAILYRRDHTELGVADLTDDQHERIEVTYSELLEKYGKSFKGTYGWALDLVPNPEGGGLDQLETLVDLSHRRGLYRWASHEVHADAKSSLLNRMTRGDTTEILAGRVNSFLGDPAAMSLDSLLLVADSVFCSRLGSTVDLLNSLVLLDLAGAAKEQLHLAQVAVNEAEQDLQESVGKSKQK